MDHPSDTAARRARGAAALALALLVLGACSSAKGSAGAKQATTTTAPASTSTACAPPSSVPAAKAVSGSTSDWTVTSFDGTRIRAHWFPVAGASATAPAPTVLMGPGWSLPGDTDTGTSSVGLLGALTIADLHKAGYNVLTWDPRGFGASTGDVESDSPAYEGRDVTALISWVATQPGVQLDRAHDPRMGMVGASYGGGIQFVTAAADCRVDAIVPTIAWHSLGSSLYKTEIVKAGWSGLLETAAAGHSLDPHIPAAYAEGKATSQLSAANRAWFLARGPGDLVKQVKVPTLIVQGTVDTLFTLDEGVTNYGLLRKQGVPVSMLWYCSGHGVCLTKTGDPRRSSRATLAWLSRYVKRNTATSTGPRFSFVDQNGVEYTADDYPLPAGVPFTGTGRGTLPLVATGGSGPAHIPASNKDLLAGFAGAIMPSPASNAVNVPITTGSRTGVIVGAPRLQLSYQGTVPAGARPTRVFAQLVDESTGLVLGNQVTPVAVTLDGKAHTTSVPLEIVAFTVKPGARIMLQLVATTVAYAQPRLGGSVTFSHVGIVLPVAATLAPR
jgi:ABC-2 type transport system ATP-binding protein